MNNEISYRVMKWHEFPTLDSVWYQLACDCGDNEHNALIELEFDEHGIMWLYLYKNLAASCYWRDDDKWYKNIWCRLKYTWRILIKGYIEVSDEIVIVEEEHIDSFIQALEEGKRKIKKFREEREVKNAKIQS